ncbi:MAG: LuxR C-terminal-related transcriptional regulator [Proteobacteria bacterium]|nr:LuxR C-terminal-related transcriptional regulator [Pseudomonadota bacterium]
MHGLTTTGLPSIDNDATAAQAALETIGWSVMVLDADAAIHYANLAARNELRDGSTFRLNGCNLVTVHGEHTQELRRALTGAQHGKRSMLKIGFGPTARMLSFVPLAGVANTTTPPAVNSQRILVIWATDNKPLRSTLCLFAMATGLTSSEREVLEELCMGRQAQAIAFQRDVKLATVRSQIGSIRSKLGAHSVHEVIAGALTMPPLNPRVLA